MNDDLISRKSLVQNLNKFAPEHYSSLISDLIMKEPTAYDPDVVCNEIHKLFQKQLDDIFEKYLNREVEAGEADRILSINKEICEIVRNGGKK